MKKGALLFQHFPILTVILVVFDSSLNELNLSNSIRERCK